MITLFLMCILIAIGIGIIAVKKFGVDDKVFLEFEET